MNTIAILGHTGRMGSMLMNRWQSAGYVVYGIDREPFYSDKDNFLSTIAGKELIYKDTSFYPYNFNKLEKILTQAAIIVLCIPVVGLPAALEQISPLLNQHQILVDITSVKVLPMELMERTYTGPVVGTHPLFGPSTPKEDLIVAITPGTQAQQTHINEVETLFTCFGSRYFHTTPEKHDRGVAYIQGLNFISSVAYFASLAENEDLMPFITPSFKRRLEASKKLLTEDSSMFETFTMANPMTKEALQTYKDFLNRIENGELHEVATLSNCWYEKASSIVK